MTVDGAGVDAVGVAVGAETGAFTTGEGVGDAAAWVGGVADGGDLTGEDDGADAGDCAKAEHKNNAARTRTITLV